MKFLPLEQVPLALRSLISRVKWTEDDIRYYRRRMRKRRITPKENTFLCKRFLHLAHRNVKLQQDLTRIQKIVGNYIDKLFDSENCPYVRIWRPLKMNSNSNESMIKELDEIIEERDYNLNNTLEKQRTIILDDRVDTLGKEVR
jgi:hypothetical protein